MSYFLGVWGVIIVDNGREDFLDISFSFFPMYVCSRLVLVVQYSKKNGGFFFK